MNGLLGPTGACVSGWIREAGGQCMKTPACLVHPEAGEETVSPSSSRSASGRAGRPESAVWGHRLTGA